MKSDQINNHYRNLREWLFRSALPLWADIGIDRQNGGFHERLTSEGAIIHDARRARLVARQIYVYSTAAKLGWTGDSDAIVRHGLDWLLGKMVEDGTVTPVVDGSGAPISNQFDLYDHAFVLFSLAFGPCHYSPRPLEAEALAVYRHMAPWRHSYMGFQETLPPSVPLKANPHMHLLEAALAWEQISDEPGWSSLADELAELCLTHFISSETGALHEYFDQEWHAMKIPGTPEVEPGHQYEWAWLLLRWGELRSRPDALSSARRLIHLTEKHGVSRQCLAVNGLARDLTVADSLHRLWPQTERIKALAALATISKGTEKCWAIERLVEANRGLARFFDHPVKGAWWEHLDENGAPKQEPTRASSLYHITCAFSELASRLPALA